MVAVQKYPRRHFWDPGEFRLWSLDFPLRFSMESPDSRVRTHQSPKNASWNCKLLVVPWILTWTALVINTSSVDVMMYPVRKFNMMSTRKVRSIVRLKATQWGLVRSSRKNASWMGKHMKDVSSTRTIPVSQYVLKQRKQCNVNFVVFITLVIDQG